MFAVCNRDGRLVALTDDESVIGAIMSKTAAQSVNKLTADDSYVVDESGFTNESNSAKIHRLRDELNRSGVNIPVRARA